MKNKSSFTRISWILIFIMFSITACASMTIVDVEWDTLEGPQKARQFLGISNSEVKVFAHFKNGDRRQTRAGTLRYDKNTIGPQTVIVSVGGSAGGSFETEVMELTGIRIERPPAKISYTEGEQAALSGIRVMGTWVNMPDVEIPVSQLRVAGFDSSAAGSTDITVNYNGMNASFPVTVTARPVAPASVPGTTQAAIPAGEELVEEDSDSQHSVDPPEESDDTPMIPNDNELEALLRETPNPRAVVNPLTQAKWNQRSPYNDLFPLDSDGTRAVTLCETTARAIIMAYHRHPARGPVHQGQYRGVNVNFNNAFDWNNMLNSYRADGRDSNERQRNAVAVLMINIRAAKFNTSGGGDNTSRVLHFFGYDRSIQRHSRTFYTDAEWEAMIRRQLDAGLPIYYSSRRLPNNGHAFVVDGYDNQGRFHVNWGWGGSRDGWYSLNALRPSPDRFYDRGHAITINIKPDAGGTGSHEMGLSSFTANTTTVTQNEALAVTANVTSFGFFSGGQVGAALTSTTSGAIAAQTEFIVIGTANYGSRSPNQSSNITMNCFVPDTVRTGQYNLRIVTRETGGEWKTVTRSAIANNIPSSLNITVNPERGTPGGGYGLSLREFSTDKTTVGRNETFAVTVNHRNRGEGQFPGGTIGVVLVDNNGYIVGEALGTRNRGALTNSWTNPITINCTIPYNGINPGNYRLRIAVRIAAGGWRISSIAEGNVPTAIDFTVTQGVRTPFLDFFHSVAAYRSATGNIEVVVNQDFTIDQLVSIPAPAAAGVTLTIRSANSARPVTLTRGVSGNLFTVPSGTTVIFRDIIIDGGASGSGAGGAFADNGGGTLVRVNGGSFTMNAGTVLRNNVNTGDGGGVIIASSGTFNMSGGEISGNTGKDGGGIRLSGGTLTMQNGRISGNTANLGGGGASVSGSSSVFNFNGGSIIGNTSVTNPGGGIAMWSSATVNMTGGEIIGNNAPNGSGVRRGGGTFNINGGVVAGTGSALANVVNGTHSLNAASPGNAVIIAWNRPADTLNYTEGTNNHLTLSAGAAAAWTNQNGVLGISYTNGANRGWIKAW